MRAQLWTRDQIMSCWYDWGRINEIRQREHFAQGVIITIFFIFIFIIIICNRPHHVVYSVQAWKLPALVWILPLLFLDMWLHANLCICASVSPPLSRDKNRIVVRINCTDRKEPGTRAFIVTVSVWEGRHICLYYLMLEVPYLNLKVYLSYLMLELSYFNLKKLCFWDLKPDYLDSHLLMSCFS